MQHRGEAASSTEPCLYCGKTTGPFIGEAHVFPEALVANRVVLPPGVVCDPCNSYMGQHLDSALVRQPFISLAIQFLGTPGKRGRPRARIGNVERNPDTRELIIPTEAPEEVVGADGRRSYRARPLLDIGYRARSFSRALYHIGLNLLALELGPDFARRPQFDGARGYVREPRRHDWKPIVSTATPLGTIRPLVEGARVREAPGETVCLRIFNFDFYVDLLDRGGLLAWAFAHLPPPVHIIDRSPFTHTASSPDLGKRYRLRIQLPGGDPEPAA